jgi:mannose/fructose/N-acetylgalactosamine-specific phosphotransferase system component IID
LHLAGVFAYATWWPHGWQLLPDFSAIALTAVAAWLLIARQRNVMQVLGLCAVVGLVVQALH